MLHGTERSRIKEKLLEVKNLRTYYFTSLGSVKAVDGVSFEIHKGESVGLVGESGCGKSCTALSLMRLLPASGKTIDGEVIYNGKNLLSLKESEMRRIRGKEIGMIFQDPFTFLNPLMKVGDQVAENITVHQNIGGPEVRKRVFEVLERVRLPSPERVAGFYPHELSGGMRQRAVIAMSISSRPNLLIADEPTTALDVTIQRQILQLIGQLKEELNISLLLITHDLGIIAETCDSICVMYAGKIVESGDTFSIFEKPRHPYTIGLLNSAMSIEEYKKELSGIGGTVPNLMTPPSGCRFHPRCEKAKESCTLKEPSFVELNDGRRISCWQYA